MTNKTEQIREAKKLELELLSLEAKILKCLNHEDGQMFLEYIELGKTTLLQKLSEQKQDMLSKIKGLGCNPENDSLTVARILNELR